MSGCSERDRVERRVRRKQRRALPLTELLDEQAGDELLVSGLSPKGLRCPAAQKGVAGQAPHMSDRAPGGDYRGRGCG